MRYLTAAFLAAGLLAGPTSVMSDDTGIRAVVPTMHVSPGQTLERSMLRVDAVEPQAYRQPVQRLENAVGMEAKRVLRADEAIGRDEIRRPTVVDRGDRVSVIYRAGAIRVKTAGKAREDGSPGEAIDVMILETRETLTGKVIEAGTVRVEG